MKSIAIDAEGFPRLGDLRWQDQESGAEFFKNFTLNANKNVVTRLGTEEYVVHAYDEPLVAQTASFAKGRLTIEMPFASQSVCSPNELFLDEWDRIRGFDERGISFVCSRKAQAQLFAQASEFDDESITLDGLRLNLPDWYDNEGLNWDQAYSDRQIPWDLGEAAPAFVELLPRLKLPKQRVLVLGCGQGWDALHFAQLGHRVTAVDVSSTAIEMARQNDADKLVNWICADAWSVDGQFDLVVEHTFYAAIAPKERNQLVRLWRQKLTDQGQLLGIFFAMPKRHGPPFGGSEWELKRRLGEHFQALYWSRVRSPTPHRQHKEFLVLGRFLNP